MKKVGINMKNIKHNYEEAKKIIEIAFNPNHQLNEFVRQNTTLEQIDKLQEFVRWCEDQGVQLIN